MTKTIAPEELAKQQRSGKVVDLVDVRNSVEFREVHVDFARNIPLGELDVAKLAEERREKNEPLYVI